VVVVVVMTFPLLSWIPNTMIRQFDYVRLKRVVHHGIFPLKTQMNSLDLGLAIAWMDYLDVVRQVAVGVVLVLAQRDGFANNIPMMNHRAADNVRL
jgi:hypothetical protein